ncbi:MAG: glycosyltransferase family 39 protein [Pyrinomonadaceae bacterium]
MPVKAVGRTIFSWSLIIWIVAFLARATFVLVKTKTGLFRGSFYTTDSQVYDALAQSLIEHRGLAIDGRPTAVYPPVYPMFLAVCYWIFGKNFLLIGIIQSGLSALACVFAFKTAQKIFDDQTARLTGLICALMPDLIFWASGSITTEALYTFLLTASVYFLVLLLPPHTKNVREAKSRSSIKLNSIIAGVLLGLSALTRPLILYFVLFAVLYLWLYVGFVRAMVVGSVFLIIVFPWAYRNQRTMGSMIFTSTGGGVSLYHYHNPVTSGENGGYTADLIPLNEAERAPEVERDRLYRRAAITYALQHPIHELGLTFHRFWNMWRPGIERAPRPYHVIALLTYVPLMLFAIPTIFVLGFHQPRVGLLNLFLLYNFVFHLITVAELRYRIPLEPVLIIFGAVGIIRTVRLFQQRQFGLLATKPRLKT